MLLVYAFPTNVSVICHLRCIKACDMQFLSEKYGVTILLVSEKCFEIYNPNLIL